MTTRQRRPEAVQALPAASASSPRLIRKVLVANRGEIACRIMRTCRAMGIATVAVFAEADAHARHLDEADEAVRIGPSAASASYLNIRALIEAARRTGADAMHPGYGFLSEQASFARACRDAGITFIGPSPEIIARMGSKREARRMMASAAVPVVPGYDGEEQSDERLLAAAREIGFPLLVKASAGGGGKGMRTVERAEDLAAALAAARREAQSAFGDATLLLETLVREPRHVEFQIFGDEQGHLIHLGERECSIQRRHQKIIEETPSPALTPELRARMAQAAITVGRQLGYVGAGTVEFVLDPEGRFYFLEVNTRLQVEHPVTELVTGLDLVRWQIEVAEGRPLPLTQEQVCFDGHAVEARVYAEDPASGFLPATGRLALWREPTGEGIRIDAGVRTGEEIGIYYDPLLAKICAHGADRAEALRRLERALGETVLFGVGNNLDFLRRALLHPAHLAGSFSTEFIARYSGELLAPRETRGPLPREPLAALLAAVWEAPSLPEPRGWRNNPGRPPLQRYAVAGSRDAALHQESREAIELEIAAASGASGGALAVAVRQGTSSWRLVAQVRERAGADLTVELDGHVQRAVIAAGPEGERWVKVGGSTLALVRLAALPDGSARHLARGVRTAGERHLPSPQRRRGVGDENLAAPMPGQVVAVLVQKGQQVCAGDPVMVLEAMKMEHTLRAPRDGTIAVIHVRAGDQAQAGAILLEVRVATGEVEPPPV